MMLTDDYMAERRRACEWFTRDPKNHSPVMVDRSLRELAYLNEIARLRAELDATREALVDAAYAANEVNDRYIGGSPVTGRLGKAIEGLAAVCGRHVKVIRAAERKDGA